MGSKSHTAEILGHSQTAWQTSSGNCLQCSQTSSVNTFRQTKLVLTGRGSKASQIASLPRRFFLATSILSGWLGKQVTFSISKILKKNKSEWWERRPSLLQFSQPLHFYKLSKPSFVPYLGPCNSRYVSTYHDTNQVSMIPIKSQLSPYIKNCN